MIKVVETKKLTKLDFNGKEIVVNSEDTTVWNQVKTLSNDNEIIINEGDNIQFLTDDGSIKEGIVAKLSGKKEKTKIKIAFSDEHEETWGVCSIKEGTLKVLNQEEETDDEEE